MARDKLLQIMLRSAHALSRQHAGPCAFAGSRPTACSQHGSAWSTQVSPHRSFSTEEAKVLVDKHLTVNTLKLAKQFEAAGLERKTAEQLADYITELIVLNKARMEDTFVNKHALDKLLMEQETRLSGLKAELTKAQDVAHQNMNKDLDRQQSFLDKMRTEVKHEIDKLIASQRLDMNLEKGRMRDDFQLIRDKATELEIKVDRDINELKSSVEKAKNDTIKSVITILGTFSAIAFTISRFVQMAG